MQEKSFFDIDLKLMLTWLKKHQKILVYSITFISFVLAPFYTNYLKIFQALGGYVDFMIMMQAGQRILHHELIYNAQDIAQDIPYFYAPFSAYFMGLYRIIIPHERWAICIWTLSSYVFFGFILMLCARITKEIFGKKDFPWFFYPVVIFLCFRYFLSNIQNGQVNVLLDFLLLLSLYLLYHKKDLPAGVLLSIAVLIKLPFLIFILFFVVEKRWKALSSFFITTAALLLLPALHLGWHENLFFLSQWKVALAAKSGAIFVYFKNFSNQSLICFYGRLIKFFVPTIEFSTLYSYVYFLSAITAIPLVLGSLYVYKIKEKSPHIKFWGLASCLMVLMIILSPAAWKATFTHLLFPYSFLLMYGWRREKTRYFIPLFLALSFALSSLINEELFSGGVNIFIHQLSFIFVSALVVLYLLLALPFRKCAQQDSNLQPSD